MRVNTVATPTVVVAVVVVVGGGGGGGGVVVVWLRAPSSGMCLTK